MQYWFLVKRTEFYPEILYFTKFSTHNQKVRPENAVKERKTVRRNSVFQGCGFLIFSSQSESPMILKNFQFSPFIKSTLSVNEYDILFNSVVYCLHC
jgi:hypothetical protein